MYAEKAIEAGRLLDDTKEQLDLCRAGLDSSIRSNPEKYSLAKITESVVSNTIIADSGYQLALRSFNKVKQDYEIAKVAVRAFEQRKSALENLVKLFLGDYFSTPREPKQQIEGGKRLGSQTVMADKRKRLRKE
jgi:hypothetical protein